MLSLKSLRGSSNWSLSVGEKSTRPYADPPSPVIKGAKGQICCTSETTVAFFGRREPAIILKNNSSYQVSFWVIEEDKTKPTKAALDKISKQMGAPVEQDNPTPTNTTTKEGSEDSYVLTADHRVDKYGTTVPFLKGSNSMRVLGFFRKDSSKTWMLYKNKVYSIRWGKMIFTLVATDENIEKHQQLKTSEKTKIEKNVTVPRQTEGGELDKINCKRHA